jgi:hypothetical protein
MRPERRHPRRSIGATRLGGARNERGACPVRHDPSGAGVGDELRLGLDPPGGAGTGGEHLGPRLPGEMTRTRSASFPPSACRWAAHDAPWPRPDAKRLGRCRRPQDRPWEPGLGLAEGLPEPRRDDRLVHRPFEAAQAFRRGPGSRSRPYGSADSSCAKAVRRPVMPEPHDVMAIGLRLRPGARLGGAPVTGLRADGIRLYSRMRSGHPIHELDLEGGGSGGRLPEGSHARPGLYEACWASPPGVRHLGRSGRSRHPDAVPRSLLELRDEGPRQASGMRSGTG